MEGSERLPLGVPEKGGAAKGVGRILGQSCSRLALFRPGPELLSFYGAV